MVEVRTNNEYLRMRNPDRPTEIIWQASILPFVFGAHKVGAQMNLFCRAVVEATLWDVNLSFREGDVMRKMNDIKERESGMLSWF